MAKRAYDHTWQKMRRQILDRDQNLCRIGLKGCTKQATCVDHIVPLAEGGSRLDPDNLRAACDHCNTARVSGRQKALAEAFNASRETAPSRRW